MDAGVKSRGLGQTDKSLTFPKPGTVLYNLIVDPQYRQIFRARNRQGNRWVVLLYRLGVLPLFGKSKQVLLLITKGRKSQRTRYTPNGYIRVDNEICLLTSWGKQADWYRNIQAYPDDVSIQIGFQRIKVIPEYIEDAAGIQHFIEQLVCQDPQRAQVYLGWNPAQDKLDRADFSLCVDKVMVIRFHRKNDTGGRSVR